MFYAAVIGIKGSATVARIILISQRPRESFLDIAFYRLDLDGPQRGAAYTAAYGVGTFLSNRRGVHSASISALHPIDCCWSASHHCSFLHLENTD